MAAVMNQEDSDSEYQDAQEDFHNVKRNEKKNTERSRLEDLPLPVPSPGPVAPPRVKRNKKKQLEKERGSKGGLDEGTTEKNQPSPSKCPDLSRPPNALTAERIMETQDLVDNDPSVTIKEEGLLMNPELLQTSQVTVTSETPMKRSGRVAGEYRESIVSSSDSGEESAGRDGDGTLKELQPMEKCDATPVKKETEGARASLSDSVSMGYWVIISSLFYRNGHFLHWRRTRMPTTGRNI